jgi:hypothetical protein
VATGSRSTLPGMEPYRWHLSVCRCVSSCGAVTARSAYRLV